MNDTTVRMRVGLSPSKQKVNSTNTHLVTPPAVSLYGLIFHDCLQNTIKVYKYSRSTCTILNNDVIINHATS